MADSIANGITREQLAIARWWYTRGFTQGFHDGVNNLDRHDHAFYVTIVDDEYYWPSAQDLQRMDADNQADGLTDKP